jgi:oligoendopeptidase F
LKNRKVIEKYLLNDKFKTYRFGFKVLFEQKKHILSAKEEMLLSKVSRAFSDSENQFSILSNTELTYKSVQDSKGKFHKLTQGNYSSLMKNKDSVLRKNTYNEF